MAAGGPSVRGERGNGRHSSLPRPERERQTGVRAGEGTAAPGFGVGRADPQWSAATAGDLRWTATVGA
ncbi:hypothetical protein [Streptomyces sp. NPDC048442]|uniref:hypothetical protein n=1 Tax=Streptomyces sp. NPDC048442 TaxID=3154823 RepID=UPI00342A1800